MTQTRRNAPVKQTLNFEELELENFTDFTYLRTNLSRGGNATNKI